MSLSVGNAFLLIIPAAVLPRCGSRLWITGGGLKLWTLVVKVVFVNRIASLFHSCGTGKLLRVTSSVSMLLQRQLSSAQVISGLKRVALLLAICIPQLLMASDEKEDSGELAQFYGFTGVEIFKLDSRVFNIQSGDFTNDGLTDLLVVDNRSSSLQLLAQTSERAAARSSAGRVNDLTSDWRFEIQQLSVDKQIAGMTTADFNGDGRLDVAYVGVPDQLIVRYQPEKAKAEWADKWSTRLPGLKPSSWMIASGDLNSDGRSDVVVLGEQVTYVVYQNDQGAFNAPESVINTSGQLSMIQVADINGDGRNDLCYMANEGSTRGLCARLQTNDGRLSAEICFDLQQPRSVTLQNVDGKPGQEIITIESRTGRVVISGLEPATNEPGMIPERLVQYGIGQGNVRNRSFATADIDGDGLTDVVVTDPDQAQVLLYRQNGIDGLGMAESYPSLLGARDMCVADLDQDGKIEVILLSEKEGVIATSQFEEGRLGFPNSIMKKPDGLDLAAIEPLAGPSGTQIVVCLSKGSGSKAKVEFRLLQRKDDATWLLASDSEAISVPGALGSRGIDLVTMDVNSDGLMDILSVPNGTSDAGVQVLLQQANGSLKLMEDRSVLDLGIASAGSLFISGNQLLAARDSFARELMFGDKGWTVKDQFNSGETSARLEGVAALNLDGQDGDEIVLVDTGIKKLRVLRKDDGLYRPWKEVELGNIGFVGSVVADLNGDAQPDLLVAGTQHFAVLYSGRRDPVMKEIASYKTERDEAYPADVIAGDINGDGVTDLTIIDTSIDGLEILRFATDHIDPVTHFRIYEEKRLVSESNSRGTEPREGVVVDVTGDGRSDLILLCHDRLLLYPQDSGSSEQK